MTNIQFKEIPIKAHQGKVWSVSWSGDGQTLASGGEDDTFKLWKRDGSLPKSKPVKAKSIA